VPIYALGPLEPDIAESAFVHPDAVIIGQVRIGPGAIVAAAALVLEGFEVPPGALVAGVPATIKKTNMPTEWVEESVQSYIASARRYQAELRRLKPSHPNDV
jgi:carbonic anhydrase/acetyltransferase-like protein (isoleucine patch superfamily)